MKKILVIGCGSIGSKHAVNASSMASVGLVDNNPDLSSALADHCGAINFGSNIVEASEWLPDGVVIATPHSAHVAAANFWVERGVPLLIEKPISSSSAQAESFLKFAKDNGVPVFGVCNMRFHPGVKAMKRHLQQIGKPLFARAHYGNFLPNMRVGRDYRETYAASADDGGVALDGIHELDYLRYLVGEILDIDGQLGRISDLEIAAEDYASISLIHSENVRSEIHLDYIRPVKRRGCELVGTLGIIDWQSEGKNPELCSVNLFTEEAGWVPVMSDVAVDSNEPFREVLLKFLQEIDGVHTILQTGREAFTLLRLLEVIK